MRGAIRTLALSTTVALAGCGGTAVSDRAGAMVCSQSQAYVGSALHAPFPASAFPSPGPAAASTAVPDGLAALLDARVDALLQQTGAPAINVAVDLPGLGRWTATRGLARVTPPQAASEATWFYWASVGKALTAVLVLQLVEEGRLRLDDRLSTWYPQMPNAALITVGQLLTHTSGLATNLSAAIPAPASSEAWLAAAVATPAIECPGSVASYSNIGFELLGRIVQVVEQQPFDAILQRRVAVPLGLNQLRALHEGEAQVAALATPHLGREPTSDPGQWLRIGAGNVIAGAQDVAAVWRAVLEGRLLRPQTVARQWSMLYPIADSGTAGPSTARSWFGQGVMLMEWTSGTGTAREWIGHLGGTPSASAVVAYDALSAAYVAAAVNNAVSAAAVANAMLDVMARWRTDHPSR
ncbi:MAG: serine hydrolase domain-containing protein [Rubrivivax sp.]